MNKAKVIGLAVTGLAVVGGLALFNYYKKPKATRGGFLSMNGNNFFSLNQSDFANADGRVKSPVRANCGRRNADGSFSYYFDTDGVCNAGFKRVAYFGDRNI
jgi:hypothetical protein